MSHGDIAFYISTAIGVCTLFGILWRLTVGETIKRMREDMVTHLDLEREFGKLREWLRKEFVSKK